MQLDKAAFIVAKYMGLPAVEVPKQGLWDHSRVMHWMPEEAKYLRKRCTEFGRPVDDAFTFLPDYENDLNELSLVWRKIEKDSKLFKKVVKEIKQATDLKMAFWYKIPTRIQLIAMAFAIEERK